MVTEMTTEPRTAKDIFVELASTPAELWDERLSQACPGDDELRARVRALLRAHADPVSFLDRPALALGATILHEPPVSEGPGTVIGPFLLKQQIGEGGFGVVFLAEQEQPVRRRLALKIVKPGMDTREVIARFEAERQALALMDHPHIAKVFDAGATDAGRPYFVMELVQGVPITDYCDQSQLTTCERLELFVTVCQAVQHAHQKGVIHRDLKPTNVLVAMQDGKPTPKIIDFGVAKAIGEQALTEHTLTTAFAQMVGTPLYMSPEQAELSPLGVDTRSDIYSLGVMLYELLTGATPFDKGRLHSASYDELRRIIREEEPPRPSARISTLAADLSTTIAERRRTDARRLRQTVGGDLDWIVMKCLEKNRNRRYESVGGLARDVVRYLRDEPVSAVAPSRLYRTSKFLHRNKWPVIAAAAVFAGLVAGIVGATLALVSESRQRAIAERERAEMQFNLAGSLQAQRKYSEAADLYRQGLDIPAGDTPADRQRAARTRLRLAEVVEDQSGFAKAERLHHEALEAYRGAFPPGDPNITHALFNLANGLRREGRFADAESFFREIYEIHRRAVPTDHRAIGESATNLANVLITLGHYAAAESLAREAIVEHRLAVPRDEWALTLAQLELGRGLISMGKFPEAEIELLAAERVFLSTDQFHLGLVAMAALYTAWDQAEPGKGHDAKADQWIRKLVRTFVPLEEASIPSLVIRTGDLAGEDPSLRSDGAGSADSSAPQSTPTSDK
jgi:serine/threonine protein kinase